MGEVSTGTVCVGVDIGGTKIVAGAVDEHGRIIDQERRNTPDRRTTPDVVQGLIVDAVQALASRHDVGAVGIGAAGFVDGRGERVMFAPHLAWRDEPLKARVRDALGIPVYVDNDANTALWAEHRFGSAIDSDEVVMITLGTGIGGALLIDGSPYRGSNGMAGEFGHMQVVPDGRPCECGKTGCWEQYCSGKALNRFAEHAGSERRGPELDEAAVAGDPVALGAFSDIGRWLGLGVANVIAAFDASLVVVGGGVSSAGELLLAPARLALRDNLVGRGYRAEPELVRATLGPMAGLVGAADLARSLL